MPHDTYSAPTRLSAITFDTASCRDDYRTRLEVIARELGTLGADIVLLQNVFATGDNRYNTADFLARRLGMNSAFLPMRAKVRHLNGRPIYSYGGLAILARHAIRACTRVELPCDPRDGERIAQLADLDIDGVQLLIANIQVCLLAGADPARRHQIEYLARVLGEASDHDHILLGGDFNAGPDEPALHPIRALGSGDGNFTLDEAAPDRGVDRLFALSRRARPGAAQRAILRLSDARAGLDRLDPATNQYPGDRAGLTADVIMMPWRQKWPQNNGLALPIAAE